MTTTTPNVPSEVLHIAVWADGPAAERDTLIDGYLNTLEQLADPQLLEECLAVGLLHDTPEIRRQALAAAVRLAPELAAEAVGWALADPDESVRAPALASLARTPALRSAGGPSALHALLAVLGRSPDQITAGVGNYVTVADAHALASAQTLLADTALAATVLEDLPVPLSADRLPSRLSLEGMRHIPAGRLRRGTHAGEAGPFGELAQPSPRVALLVPVSVQSQSIERRNHQRPEKRIVPIRHAENQSAARAQHPRELDDTRFRLDEVLDGAH